MADIPRRLYGHPHFWHAYRFLTVLAGTYAVFSCITIRWFRITGNIHKCNRYGQHCNESQSTALFIVACFVLQVLILLHFIVGLFQGIQEPVRYSMTAEFFPVQGRGAVMMLMRVGWPIGGLCATFLQRFVHPLNLPQMVSIFVQGWHLCLILSCFPFYILLLIGLIW